MSDLVATLRGAVDAHPDRIALRCGPTGLSYADLLTASARFGHRLRSGGVVAGDRVALAMPNAPGHAVAQYAALHTGAVVVPVNPWQHETVLGARLHDAGPRLLAVSRDAPSAVRRAAAAAGVPLVELDDLSGGDIEIDSHRPSGDDPALIVYKSGDGDGPTGVMLSHRNLGWSAAAAVDVLGLTETDVLASYFPLAHPLGQTYGLGAAIAAGCCLTLPVRSDAAGAPARIETDGATVLGTFPELVGTILADPALRRPGTPTPRTVFCSGGGGLAPRIRERLGSRLRCEVLEGYGTVETSALGCASRAGSPGCPGSVGPAVPGVEVAVADARGREAPDHRSGHLLLRGPNVTEGYWRRPRETARVFHDGWLLTGQKARRDADGNIHLLNALSWAAPLGRRGAGDESSVRRGLRRLRG